MLKIKPLQPTLREKKRYIVYSITSDENINMHSAQKNILEQIQTMLGVFQSAKAGVMPLKFDDVSKKGIFRVNNTAVDLVRSCFVLIKEINRVPVCVQTIGVSGILKKAKYNFFTSHNQE